jgi:hypothetical protein
MIDKMDLIEKPIISHKPKFTFIFDKLSENKVLYFKEAFIGRKDPLFFINEAGLTL